MTQNDPIPNELPQIADLVIADINKRRQHGIQTYGVPLQPMNGRDAMVDLYEELLDGAHYIRQRIEEETEHFVRMAGDPDATCRLAEIRELAVGIRQNAPETSAAHDLAQGTIYVLQLLEAQGHELRKAVQALVRAEHPPADLEVAGLQFRVVGNGEAPEYDSSHDWDEIADWAHGRYTYVEGYYPEYRPVYGGAWRPVTPGAPPEIPEGHYAVPPATEPPEQSAGRSETSRKPLAPDDAGLPVWLRAGRELSGLNQQQAAAKAGIRFSRLVQLENFYVSAQDYEIDKLIGAYEIGVSDGIRILELTWQSRERIDCPDCPHMMATHTRTEGCRRCTCSTGKYLLLI